MALDTAPKLRKKSVVGFIAETTTGTPGTVLAANAVTNIFNAQSDYTTEMTERQAQGSLSPIADGTGARAGKITFETELVGSGASGTTPSWLALFLACSAMYNGGVLTPLSGSIATVTFYHDVDGRRRILSGCQGNAVIKFRRGQQTRIAWTFSGVQQPTVDATILAPTYVTSPIAAKPVAFSFASNNLRMPDLDFDLGNEVMMREDMNGVDSASAPTGYRNAYVTNRKPMLTLAPEALPIATLDLANLFNTQALSAVSMTVGAAAFNTFVLAAPKVQIVEYPGMADRQGLYVENIKGKPTRNTSAGDDEWSLTLS